MITQTVVRYFALPANQIQGNAATLIPDGDFLPITLLDVIVYPYPTADGRYIVKAMLPPNLIKEMAYHCLDYGVEDPLTMDGVVALGIGGSFAGRTREDVIAMFPEMAELIEIEVDGETVLVPRFPLKLWSFEV